MAAILMDEISLADPELIAVLNDSAGWGRMKAYGLSSSSFVEKTFGNTMLQAMLGDFLQLNPVKSHSLLGCYLQGTGMDIPGVPSYENAEHAVKAAKLSQVKKGYDVFDKVSKNVIIFRGAYRFDAGDPVAKILETMRTPGGAKLPREVLIAMVKRIFRPSSFSEDRLNPDYVLRDEHGQQIGPTGFFAQGFHSAINWDQVARLQQIWAVQAARLSMGPVAWQNHPKSGSPQHLHWTWPPAACKKMPEAIKAILAQLDCFFRSTGQLLFYVQAVDVCNVKAYAHRHDVYTQAMNVANMASGTNGLIGILAWFMGMRIKLTKKIQPPDLVQECPAEVIGVRFHPDECFGMPHSSAHSHDGMPPAHHECWSTGCVLLDRLPLYLEVRVIGSTTDYTGTNRPGVFFLEPVGDSWTLRYRLSTTVSHPHALKKRRTQITPVAMTRYQIPAAPETVGTYNNFQGKTVQGPSGEPCGHTIDLMKPDYMSKDEYKQHVYMILGRAKKLEWTLLKNFPHEEDGELDLEVFESGPPDYIIRNMEELERRDQATSARMPEILQSMRCFPKHAHIPKCIKDEKSGNFMYDTMAWDTACDATPAPAEPQAHPVRRRLRTKTANGEVAQQTEKASASSGSKRLSDDTRRDDQNAKRRPEPGKGQVPDTSTSSASCNTKRLPDDTLGDNQDVKRKRPPAGTSSASSGSKKVPDDTFSKKQDVKRRRLPARTIAHGLKIWALEHLKLELVALEAGGGGDCLFLSIAAGLQELAISNPNFRQHGCCTMLDFDVGASSFEIARALRHIVGQRVSEKPPEEFLDLMLTWALTEKAAPNTWLDGWSPSELLSECGFDFLLNFENVRAVGCTPGDDPDSLVFVGRCGSHDVSYRVDNGNVILDNLRRACQNHLSIMGNHHWGTATDVVMLSEALNVGFMILSNTAQQWNAQDSRWMFGLNLERADFPYWMTLYNIDQTHFQLLACTDLNSGPTETCIFSAAETPLALRTHWNLCNERHFGAASQGGIS